MATTTRINATANPRQAIAFEIVEVTPKTAELWLKKNHINRPLSLVHIRDFAARMESGDWKYNGQDIIFGVSGGLLDGQHRLSAIVETGLTFDLGVKWNVPDEAFDTLDSGTKRTIGHVFAIKGYANYNQLAATARWLHLFKYGNMRAAKVGGQRMLTAPVLERTVDAYPGIVDAVQDACAIKKSYKHLLGVQVYALCLYLFREINQVEGDQFMEALRTGANLSDGNPVLVLRNRLITLRQQGGESRDLNAQRVAITIKAWNAWRENRKIRVLRYSDGEEFPEPR